MVRLCVERLFAAAVELDATALETVASSGFLVGLRMEADEFALVIDGDWSGEVAGVGFTVEDLRIRGTFSSHGVAGMFERDM